MRKANQTNVIKGYLRLIYMQLLIMDGETVYWLSLLLGWVYQLRSCFGSLVKRSGRNLLLLPDKTSKGFIYSSGFISSGFIYCSNTFPDASDGATVQRCLSDYT